MSIQQKSLDNQSVAINVAETVVDGGTHTWSATFATAPGPRLTTSPIDYPRSNLDLGGFHERPDVDARLAEKVKGAARGGQDAGADCG
jgi:hypothetical protein